MRFLSSKLDSNEDDPKKARAVKEDREMMRHSESPKEIADAVHVVEKGDVA